MIARHNRFHGHNSLKRLYQRGQTARGQFMALKFSPNDRRQKYRAAVVVSKKVSKSAVVRNRIRRRVYETVRGLLPADTKPYDLVFTVFDEKVATLPSRELDKIIQNLLSQTIKNPKTDLTSIA